MRFLGKDPASSIVADGLRYRVGGDNAQLRGQLLAEHRGFCAYTERRIDGQSSPEIDHLDPGFKGQPEDGYPNWYVALRDQNAWKGPRPLPVPLRSDRSWQEPGDAASRFGYDREAHVFYATDPADPVAASLRDFLGVNRFNVADERGLHIGRLLDLRAEYGADLFVRYLRRHPEEVSFPTALAACLDLPTDELLHQAQG